MPYHKLFHPLYYAKISLYYLYLLLPPIAPGKIKGTPVEASWLISPGVTLNAAPSVLRGCGLKLTTFDPENII